MTSTDDPGPNEASNLTSPGSTHANSLGWAVFLGVSWTWCIGMFLPVLLVREYGFWGWVVFAIPNVVGAAAMGWVLKTPQVSRDVVQHHAHACKLFSAVTIAFHLFFALTVAAPLCVSLMSRQSREVTLDVALGSIIGAAALMYLYMTHRRDGDRTLAIIALIVSLVSMAYVTYEIRALSVATPEKMPAILYTPSTDLIWLSAACLFGFATCPYLDLTFHRARQHSASSRKSFGIGFGVVFFLMIIFTLIYSQPFIANHVTSWIAIFLFVHMAIQIAFTLAAHARELNTGADAAIVLTAVLTIGSWVLDWVLPDGILLHGLRAGEIIYRSFMGFYGLIFPAYVWLVMLPARGGALRLRNLYICAGAVVFALPFFWMGFVARQMIWVMPGLAVVLAARVLAKAGQESDARGFDVIAQQNSAPI